MKRKERSGGLSFEEDLGISYFCFLSVHISLLRFFSVLLARKCEEGLILELGLSKSEPPMHACMHRVYSQIVSVEAKSVNVMVIVSLVLPFASDGTSEWILSATIVMMLSKLYILYS